MSAAEKAKSKMNAQAAPKWQIQSASARWLTEPLPPREHLLVDTRTGRGAVDRSGVWLFGGAGGAGKSYATIDLAIAVASGGAWLDTFAARQGRALIIAAEDSVDDVRRRVHAIGSARQFDSMLIEHLSILPIKDCVTSLVARVDDVYAASADTKTLCAQLANDKPYDLVVIDPYGRIAGVSVDADNAAAAATISALDQIAAAARGLVLGVTHTSLRARLAARDGAAEGATGIRGATGQSDYARGVLRLEQSDGQIWLSLAKANHVAPWEPVALCRGDRGQLVRVAPADLPQRQDKAAAKEAERRERDRLDDVAAREEIGARPLASFRALRAVVMGKRGCGKDRADAAIERVKIAAGDTHEE